MTSSENGNNDWALFRDNPFRTIMQVARSYQTEMMRLLAEERGHAHLRLSYRPVMMTLPPQGIRVTELADALSMSKQNCFQLLKQIEAAGYIARSTDTIDKRARKISPTPRGRQLINDGIEVVAKVDEHCRQLVGSIEFDRLETALRELVRGLPFQHGDSASWWQHSDRPLGTLSIDLIQLAELCNGQLMALIVARGHPALRLSHSQVLLHIGQQGGRIGDIARVNDVSKQAISHLAGELTGLGYLEGTANPGDGRSKLLFFTPAGFALIADSAAACRALEQSCAAVIGAATLTQLKPWLETIDRGLSLQRRARDDSRGPLAEPAANLLDLALYLVHQVEGRRNTPAEQRLLCQGDATTGFNQRALALAKRRRFDPQQVEDRLRREIGEPKLTHLQQLLEELGHEPAP